MKCRPLSIGFVLLLAACAPRVAPDPLQGSSSSVSSESSESSEVIQQTAGGINFTLPAGFGIEQFAGDLPGARVIVRDGRENFWVSQTGEGIVSQLVVDAGAVVSSQPVFRNLNRPHGLALDPADGMTLYVAEEDAISRTRFSSDGPLEKIADLPSGGGHFTRTLGFKPDGRLYVSIGSTCDVCVEEDPYNAAILSMKRDGSDVLVEAEGLRNAVFFTWSPVDGRLWATEMGRDHLGDHLPPDEVNIITEGSHYGWPFCYGDRIRDTTFQPSSDFSCKGTVPATVDLPAHVAPLGLAFVPEEGWPEEYWYDLLVAEHGSWNSSVPVGYKIVRIPLDAKGNQEGPIEDFVTGFMDDGFAKGRPVDLLITPAGELYITDDKAGVVWKLRAQTK